MTWKVALASTVTVLAFVVFAGSILLKAIWDDMSPEQRKKEWWKAYTWTAAGVGALCLFFGLIYGFGKLWEWAV